MNIKWILPIGLIMLACPLCAGGALAVPEPSSFLLVGGGVAALVLLARKHRGFRR